MIIKEQANNSISDDDDDDNDVEDIKVPLLTSHDLSGK